MNRALGGVLLLAAVAAVAVACGSDGGTPGGDEAAIDECDWPMWGHGVERTFSYPDSCDTALAPDTVGDLRQDWFFATDDAVTATPAVVDGTVYVGDWSGRFYAVDLATGELEWSYRTDVHPVVYAGQIVSSAAVADVRDRRLVFFGAGKTVYALDTADGSLAWARELGETGAGRDRDPTEVESSPVVVDGMVLVGFDVHNSPGGEPAGVVALDAASGGRRWTAKTAPTTGDAATATGSGCADVWGSPSVDVERRLAFVGTGNCTIPEGWGPNSEVLLALDLDRGTVEWTYQPHEQNLDDLDFAGAPNLFAVGDRDVVGLGGKDGVYYAVDRSTGELVWSREVAAPGIPQPGRNYSTGGFIGATAYAEDDGLVVGGTAVGGDPYLHAIDAASGEIAWQQPAAGPTYAAATEANGVVFIGGTDFTFRALDLDSGEVLWSQEMQGVVAGGAAVVGDDVIAVAGLREPGDSSPNRTAGVYRFTLDEVDDEGAATSAATTTAPASAEPIDPAALAQPCVADPCALGFDLTTDRVGGDVGSGTLHIEASPFRVTVSAEGLGEPARWLRPGSAAAGVGARHYGVYLSQGTDNPVGGLVCVLDEDFDCTGTENPLPGATYDRVSILAVDEAGALPSITEGLDRMVATNSIQIPFAPS